MVHSFSRSVLSPAHGLEGNSGCRGQSHEQNRWGLFTSHELNTKIKWVMAIAGYDGGGATEKRVRYLESQCFRRPWWATVQNSCGGGAVWYRACLESLRTWVWLGLNAGCGECTYKPSYKEVETGGSPGFTGQPPSLCGEFQANKRPWVK